MTAHATINAAANAKADNARIAQQGAAAQPQQTVRVGTNADFASADISDKRKALLTKASSALNKLGVSADIDASGDIRAQAGSAVYNAVKGVATSKGFQLILDRASEGAGIIFASPSIDISNEVLAKLGYSN